MADKSREKQFEIWRKRLRMAKDVHREKVWDWAEKVLREYAGERHTSLDTNEKYTQIAQVIMSVEETIQPSLYVSNPQFFVTAKKPEWEKREPLVAAVVNQEYTDIKESGRTIELENELVILDARLLPYGCTKTRYEVEGDILQEKPTQAFLDQAINFVTGQDNPVIETPVITEEKGHITERENPLNVIIDPTATHITRQRYTFHMMDKSRDDLRRVRYDQKIIDRVEPTITLVPEQRFKTRREQEDALRDPDFKGFRIFEVHDLEKRVIHTMMDGADDFIEFNSPHPLDKGSQFRFLWFIERPNEPYPLPPLKFYRKRADEFSYVFSQVSEQIDKFMPKVGINIDVLDKSEQDKLRVGGLGTLIAFKGSPQGQTQEINFKVADDLFKYLKMTQDMLNMEAGVPDAEVAIPDKDRSATQDVLIAKGTRGRRSKPQNRVKAFVIDQAHTIWQTLAKNSDIEKFVKVLGEQEALEWWTDPETGKQSWTKEDIAGDYSFDIDIDTAQDKAARNLQDLEALNTLKDPAIREILALEGTQIFISPIIAKIAKERWGIKDRSRILKPLQPLQPIPIDAGAGGANPSIPPAGTSSTPPPPAPIEESLVNVP